MQSDLVCRESRIVLHVVCLVRYGMEVGKGTVLVDAPFHSGDGLLYPGSQTVVGIKPVSVLWLAD